MTMFILPWLGLHSLKWQECLLESQEEHVRAAKLDREGLSHWEKQRYNDKLRLIEGKDPYKLAPSSLKSLVLPSISYPDMLNYLFCYRCLHN